MFLFSIKFLLLLTISTLLWFGRYQSAQGDLLRLNAYVPHLVQTVTVFWREVIRLIALWLLISNFNRFGVLLTGIRCWQFLDSRDEGRSVECTNFGSGGGLICCEIQVTESRFKDGSSSTSVLRQCHYDCKHFSERNNNNCTKETIKDQTVDQTDTTCWCHTDNCNMNKIQGIPEKEVFIIPTTPSQSPKPNCSNIYYSFSLLVLQLIRLSCH